MKNLSRKELQEINGGGDSYSNGISVSSSTDSLLNLTFERSYGDKHRITELSIGNNIDLNFSAFGVGANK
jgi:bacteriocin-like protein